MREVVTPGEFAEILRGVPADMQRRSVRALRSTAKRAVGVVVAQIEEAGAVDTGSLKQSVRAESTREGGTVVVDAPHAAFIEYGTRPHRPPLAPIFRWVMRKLQPESEQAGWAIARAIAAKIELEGTEPRHFMLKAMKKVAAEILPQEMLAAFSDSAPPKKGGKGK